MQIIITGGGGFLGQKLATALLQGTVPFTSLLLVDIQFPANPFVDPRVHCLQADLTAPGVAISLITQQTKLIYHLAAIVSSQAEEDFDLGWQVNLTVTHRLLESCRQVNQTIRFIFASSLAVYGGKLPTLIDDSTALTPISSYGAQKAMGEILVNDYSRKGYVDGLALRLPTICVRPGAPNRAASSFVSAIIRAPLQGDVAICPVEPHLRLWISSPETVITNLLIAAHLSLSQEWRSINLPGISVSIEEMLQSLAKVAGEHLISQVKFKPDPAIEHIVASWPGYIDNRRACSIGFQVDSSFLSIIYSFITHDLQEIS